MPYFVKAFAHLVRLLLIIQHQNPARLRPYPPAHEMMVVSQNETVLRAGGITLSLVDGNLLAENAQKAHQSGHPACHQIRIVQRYMIQAFS